VKRWTIVAAAAASVALAVAGCSGGSSGSGSGSGGNQTLTVWLMTGSASDSMMSQLNAQFEKAHPGVKVNYQIQQWDGIGQRLTGALASKTPPNVVELGSTDASGYSSQGTLADVTDWEGSLNGGQWNAGMKTAGQWQGKEYGVPFYAGDRVVIYNKTLFAKAGITAPPTSNQEWLADINKLKGSDPTDPNFQPLYLAGQDWYVLLSFIWDQGGDVAKNVNGKWQGTLESTQAEAGINFYKQLVDTSGTTAPKNNDEANPQQGDVFAKGDVAMMIGASSDATEAEKSNPAIKSDIGAFPIPSMTAGKTAPVFLGGSVLGVPVNSANQDLAKDWLSLMTNSTYQMQLETKSDWIPGTISDTSGLATDPVAAAGGAASHNGKSTPAIPQWATVENGQNPLKDMMTNVLTGTKTTDQAAKDADTALTQILQASS
jgi:N,N'-diacetylchitobiose transport system substrate-binding protein